MRNHRINKPTSGSGSRRPVRKFDDHHAAAAQFLGSHGNTGDEDIDHALYADAVMDLGEHHGHADADPDPDHGGHHHHHHHIHGPHVDDALEHGMAPMAPMTPSHHHHPDDLDALTAPELLRQSTDGLLYAAAAAADLREPSSPPPPVGNAMPAPQPLVAATDFQPNPLPPQIQIQPQPQRPQPQPQPQPPQFQQAHAPSPPPPPPQQTQQQQQPQPAPPRAPAPVLASAPLQQQQHAPHHRPASSPSPAEQQPPQKTTEQMAQDSGYEGFKVDSAFAKRMSRDPGQRLAEQRREGQELNLVRRSNVEALFAQIAGTEAANSCTHCKKGQGPWTVCVVYSGQMMGSCANCWFNASGSRCSFHEKSQPPQPVATHPYAVPVALPSGGATTTAVNGEHHSAVGGSGFGASNGVSPAQLQAAALWNASGAVFSHDAGVKGTVQSALLQVREATPYQRALIQVEVAAKQLALKIVEAEELAVGLGQGHRVEEEEEDGEQQQQTHLHHHHHAYDSPPGDDDVVVGGR